MKKLFGLFLVAGLLAFSSNTAQAQVQIGVNGNVAIPLGPEFFSDNFNAGFGGTLKARYMLSEQASVGVDVSYFSFGVDGDADFNLTVLPITANFDYAFSTEAFQPYIGAGFGIAILDATGDDAVGAESESDFVISPYVGFKYFFSDAAGLNFQAGYQVILTEGDATSHLPIGVGVFFNL